MLLVERQKVYRSANSHVNPDVTALRWQSSGLKEYIKIHA